MLTTKDIKLITSLLATKEDLKSLVPLTDFNDFKSELFTTLDGIAKSIDDLKMEYIAIKVQLDRHERWIQEIAKKAGVQLKV